ncbi:MAG: alpha-amylase family glycosyl hydrolase [Chloroflexota bacterium]
MGDLDGLTSRLDYIQGLGADTLWLMPIHPSPSAHGYDVTDYYAVNPDYGTLQDLQELVHAAHARGMRVLLDFVPSHLSREHPFFQDAFARPESIHSDWFLWTDNDHTRYASFDGQGAMPRLNHHNPEVVEYLTRAILFWLDLDSDGDYRDGVDGFRMDNAVFPPADFFRSLRQSVKEANPEAVLLGEAWLTNTSDLSSYFEDEFDALFDFPLYSVLEGNQDFNQDGLLAGAGHPALLSMVLQEQSSLFPPQGLSLRFLSNHDTNRLASEVASDPARLRLAAALLASLPGPMMIYYGEEIGMRGEKGGMPDWDNYRREPMDWYASQLGEGQTTWFRPTDRWNQPFDGVSVEEQETDPESLLHFLRHTLQIRQAHRALREGTLAILPLQSSARGAWAFTRIYEEETIVAVFNFSAEPVEVTIESFPLAVPELTDLISGQRLPGPQGLGAFLLSLPAASALLLTEAP